MKTKGLLMLLSVLPLVATAADFTVSGDLRIGYIDTETRSRTGITSDIDSIRARARLALRGELSPEWHFGGRLAGVYDTRQTGSRLWYRGWAPSPAGLNPGQTGADELYLEWRPEGSAWRARFGRMQVAFPLEDMMKKSLDYNDSPNFDVSWTDGLWLQHRGETLNTHLVFHHNARQGPTRALRAPLDFTDGASRIGGHLALAASGRAGPVTQRMLSVAWLPSAVQGSDYLTVTLKGVAEWSVSDKGMRFALGTEAGYAFETLGTGGFAWQASLNLLDFVPRQNVALVVGRVAEGWLISGDFRPNESLLELRWAWRVNASWTLDARVRRRAELKIPVFALMARRTDDLYLRATLRF